jgi:hypothetical protein
MNNVVLKVNAKREDVYKFITDPMNFDGVVCEPHHIKITTHEKHGDQEKFTYEFPKEYVISLTTYVTQINNKQTYEVKTISVDSHKSVQVEINYEINKGHRDTSELIIHYEVTGPMSWATGPFMKDFFEKFTHKLEKKFH